MRRWKPGYRRSLEKVPLGQPGDTTRSAAVTVWLELKALQICPLAD